MQMFFFFYQKKVLAKKQESWTKNPQQPATWDRREYNRDTSQENKRTEEGKDGIYYTGN